MEIITKEEFEELVNYEGSPCISIYIPSHRSGVEVNEKQDPLVFKNALQTANSELQKQGLDNRTIENLLKPGFELYKNEVFWNSQLDGLAVFFAEGFFKTIQLPYTANEEVFINSSFFISPLLPAITNKEDFYVLVLSKKDARFYQANAFGIQRVEVEGLPNGMDDVVHFEEKEDQQLFRQGGKGGTGSASFHGHGEGQLDDKANLGIYFQEVDKTLFAEVLHDKHAPLVLAGVEYEIPIYKGVSKYKNIMDDAITGNREYESQNTLFAMAREKVAPYFKQRVKAALQNYYNGIATPLTSSMPDKIIPASFYAQISDLFICKGEHIWGKFDQANNVLEIHQSKQPGDECLINKAAANTFLNGGTVYLLDREQMPKESVIAAFLRF